MAEEKTKTDNTENRPMDVGTDSTLAFFEFVDWFEKNRPKVFMGLAVIAVGFLAFYGMQSMSKAKESKASNALALVLIKDLDEDNQSEGLDYMSVVDQFPGSQAGARALILGGNSYFDAMDYEKAKAAFDRFLADYANQPSYLIQNAKFGQARCVEALGNADQALLLYQTLNEAYQPSLAQAAQLATGRILMNQNKLKDAYLILDKLSLGTGFSYQTRQAAVLKQEILKLDPSVKPEPVVSSDDSSSTNALETLGSISTNSVAN